MAITTHRKFIAAVAALSILITGFGAVQAQAADRNTERALAAILGLAVIGAIIASERDDDRDRQTQKVIRPAPTIQARPLPDDLRPQRHAAGRKALPEQCLRDVRTRDGTARYFGVRCMNQNYRFVNRLPNRCERRIQTNHGVRYGWGARCLRQEGYTLARR